MDLIEIIKLVKNKSYVLPYSNVWLDIYLRLSLYINGIKPNYRIEKDQYYKFPSFRYEDIAIPYTRIYDTEVFSRYPHDSLPQLNFRKSIAAIDDMKSICDKFIEQSTSIIFQGNNFTVETEDQKLRMWIDMVRIDGFEFYEWVKKVLYPRMFVDPNAWLCVVENHRQELLPSEFAMPMPVIIGSDRIFYSDYYNLVTDGFAMDTMQQILHKNFEPETFISYQHRMNELPCFQLGGKYLRPFTWHSFIQSFVGIANSYIQEKSDSVIAKKLLAPRLQVIESQCQPCNGTGKCDTAEGQVKCDRCTGTGKISINLGEVVGIPEPKAILDDKLVNLDRFKYTTPDTSYIEMLKKDADTEFMRAEKSLFVWRKETATSESAESFSKQFEEKKTFYQGVSERLYYLMYETLKYVSMYLNYNNGTPSAALFTIDKPIHFDLSSAEDLLLQYEAEKKNKMGTVFTNESELSYIKKVEGDDALVVKKLEFLQLYDPLYGTTDVILAGYQPLDVAIHNYLQYFLNLYIKKTGSVKFLEQDMEVTYNELLPLIIAKIPTNDFMG